MRPSTPCSGGADNPILRDEFLDGMEQTIVRLEPLLDDLPTARPKSWVTYSRSGTTPLQRLAAAAAAALAGRRPRKKAFSGKQICPPIYPPWK
ncbi:MAG: hypothetical protein M5U34_43475 [Chloroflexi bacterium]|nr:hypothetical protein [Chloroflexota bacterium]